MSSTRLVLVAVWFGLAGYLIWNRPGFVGWFALLFAVYNLVRWWIADGPSLPPPAPHRRRRAHDPPPYMDEYNAEFDFNDAENKAKGKR